MKTQLRKQPETIESRVEKQVLNTDQKSISNLLSEDFLAANVKGKLNKINKIEPEIIRDDLVYTTGLIWTYDLQKFKTIRSVRREIYSGIITLNDYIFTFEEQINLKDEIESQTKKGDKKQKKNWLLKMQWGFLKEDKKFLTVLKAKYFQ